MSAPRDFRPIQGYPDQEWNANIRSEYGRNFIFLGCAIVLLVVFVGLMMVLIKYFANLFRVERAPTHPPSLSTKRPNPVRMVWSTLWDQPLPPGNFRSQAGFYSPSTRRLDSEHASLYMGEM
ncbi:hypothetical protein FJT64_006607 [Amphibalanus amphitrite]|uniref:Uncharacterized protein n=1 Tax=Amphibalanus amphitrite TaxID=1232801 RepID=A0A6A4W251_AMPAM|nr:uncharacterized protein LOC122378000 [Amphibalanus amphitrite]XP_043237380.1 uncharacterized protein LOC122389417 [Amphibalanus amphitrite]KAF0295891.1 hypothetical protein FJT64_006607 [Amphibalanus amphitrite]